MLGLVFTLVASLAWGQSYEVLLGELSRKVALQDAQVRDLEAKLDDHPASRMLDVSDVCQGRLTLTSGTPVTTGDVTNAGTIYFTPFRGSKISLYNGTYWVLHDFTERSLALSVTSGSVYDVFIYNNSGTLTLELSAAWSSTTVRTDALTMVDGIYVKSGATTRRYLGTIVASASNATTDSASSRLVWNYYNRVRKTFSVSDGTSTWNYTTASWRSSNNSTANRINYVGGIAESRLTLLYTQLLTTTGTVYTGLCEDCTNGYNYSPVGTFAQASMGGGNRHVALFNRNLFTGSHYVQSTEYGGTSTTFYGQGGHAIIGDVDC